LGKKRDESAVITGTTNKGGVASTVTIVDVDREHNSEIIPESVTYVTQIHSVATEIGKTGTVAHQNPG
jgi:hypothetical protein